MNQPAPDWVSFDADKAEGVDLLGLRASVQALGNELFNGATTVTPKLRYLSIITWIIYRYSEARLPDVRASFVEFAAAQEAVIVMANRLHDRTITNLVGVTEADKALDTDRRRLPLQQLAQNIAFNIYISASRQLNLTCETGSGFNGLVKERGLLLAKEFDKIIRQSSYGPRLARRPTLESVSRSDLEELSGDVSLEAIPRGERDILIDALVPPKPIDMRERRRLGNYALLLWLSNEKQAYIEEPDIFKAAQEPPDALPRCLDSVVDGWLGYMVRDLLAVSHEAVFGAVMRQVDVVSSAREAPATSADVLAALLNNTEEKEEALRKLRLLKRDESVSTVSFKLIHERVRRACQNGQVISNGLRRWSGGLSETAIYEMALSSHEAAIALLPVAWSLTSQRVIAGPEASSFHRKILSLGRMYQIGIADVVLPKLEEFVRQDQSLADVMAELTTRSVQQHLRVAWKRFSTPQGKDVSVLIADMETWSRNNAFRAGRTDSRLWVALDWIYQLGLTNESGLTTKGAQTLKRSLKALAHHD